MTYNPMQDLTEFHDKFDRDGKARHERAISIFDVRKRMELITEEFQETMEELREYEYRIRNPDEFNEWGEDEFNPAHLAKELADLLYVVYGTAEELNIPLEEVFNEVHASNMSKVWSDGTVHYNEYGKVLKPDTYSPPELGHLFNESI